jgi:hypothetical protein
LSVSPKNPNVPDGGAIPVTVSAFRIDDFDGLIRVSIDGLPSGLQAQDAVIAPGQVTTTIVLKAASGMARVEPLHFNVVGRAGINGHEVTHSAGAGDALQLVSVIPPADIQVFAAIRELVVEPGTRKQVKINVERQNGFAGRIIVEVRNLPPGVRVIDIGLNGIVVEENENSRAFVLEAFPTAQPIEQLVHISGRIETRSLLQNSYAAEPISLKVLARK